MQAGHRIWDELVATEKLSRRRLREALKIYTRQRVYRQAVASGSHRHGLDGQPAEAISGEHQQMAKQLLQKTTEGRS